MFAKKRINEIAEYLKANNSATVTELSERFGVSEVTIRKDLTELESESLIEKYFGGAIWSGQSIANEISYDIKLDANIEEKRTIGKLILSEIKDGDTIFLDAGTTTNVIIDYFDRFESLTIITIDLLIALKLLNLYSFRVIIIGGELSRVTKAVNSFSAVDMLQQYNVDIAFMGCDSLSLTEGACTTSSDKAIIKKMGMKIANRKILLATKDKFFRRGLVTFANIEDFDKIYASSSFKQKNEVEDLDVDFHFF